MEATAKQGDEEKAKRPYTHYTPQQRTMVVFAYLENGCDMGKTHTALMAAWAKEHGGSAESYPKHLHKYAPQWLARLKHEGRLTDKPRPGPAPKLPREAALKAAELLERGVPFKAYNPHGPKTYRYVPAASWREAIENTPELAQLMTTYGISLETLRRRVKEERPDLQWLLLDGKPSFTQEEKHERQETAEGLAKMPAGYFERVHWVDEVKMLLLGKSHTKVHGWRSIHDHKWGEAIELSHYNGEPIKICLYLCVNARLGYVGHQLTTGTTGLDEGGHNLARVRYSVKPKIDWDDLGYMVSGAPGQKQTAPFESIVRVAAPSTPCSALIKAQGSSTLPWATAGPGL